MLLERDELYYVTLHVLLTLRRIKRVCIAVKLLHHSEVRAANSNDYYGERLVGGFHHLMYCWPDVGDGSIGQY